MPAFSLYIKDDLLAAARSHVDRIKAQNPASTVSLSSFITSAIRSALYADRPRVACVGKDRVSWTTAMPAEDATRTQLAALPSHPGLEVYYLPIDCDTSAIQPGAALPPEATASR